jgi:hypothetical protein
MPLVLDRIHVGTTALMNALMQALSDLCKA